MVRMAILTKSTNNKCWRGCEEKGTLLHCQWECKLVQPLWRTVWRFLKKLKIELPYDPAIPLLDIYLEKNIIPEDSCTPMFIVALFTIAKTWKKPMSINRGMDKEDVVHICNGILLHGARLRTCKRLGRLESREAVHGSTWGQGAGRATVVFSLRRRGKVYNEQGGVCTCIFLDETFRFAFFSHCWCCVDRSLEEPDFGKGPGEGVLIMPFHFLNF